MASTRFKRQIKLLFNVEELSDEFAKFSSSSEDAEVLYPKAKNLIAKFKEFLFVAEKTYDELDSLLEVINNNLEERTVELALSNQQLIDINHTTSMILESLGEGILLFDKKGVCVTKPSQLTIDFLGFDPVGKKICEILKIPLEDWDSFMDWYQYLLDPTLDFEEMASLAPSKITYGNRIIGFKYKSIVSPDDSTGIMAILSDSTGQVESKAKIEKIMNYTDMITKFFSDKEAFLSFLDLYKEEAQNIRVAAYLSSPPDKYDLLRKLHTLKGGAATLFIEDFQKLLHQAETEVLANWEDSLNKSTLSHKLVELSAEMEKSLEQFIKENQHLLGIQFQLHNTDSGYVSRSSIKEFFSLLKENGDQKLISYYTEKILTTPFIFLLSNLEQTALSTARRLGKQVQVKIECPHEMRVIAEFYSPLMESLVHVINNSIDHGIEGIDERTLINKTAHGNITITARTLVVDEASKIELTIQDDGRGIDPIAIRNKMIDNKSVFNEHGTDEEIINHIFDMGFSTSSRVTELSGRGIGMNAVKEEIQKIGGDINLKSVVGEGTKLIFTFPLMKDAVTFNFQTSQSNTKKAV